MTDAYPLRWPDGWPRTPADKRQDGAQFRRGGYISGGLPTFAYGRDGALLELRKLGATSVVISSSVDVRVDGRPRADVDPERVYKDPGVAIYFMLKNRAHVMAQDAYRSVGVNLRSLTLALEAMRALERHGGGTMMQRAFDGFAALPPPAGSKPKRPWWEVLHYPANPDERDYLTAKEVEARAAGLARKAHPDAGGSHDAMAEINVARDDAVAELRSDEQ